MPHHTISVANSVLGVASDHGEQLTPMKLQKLVYYSHGWHLGLDQGPLCDEEVEAWQWGPVFPSLYHAVKHWGNLPIAEPVRLPRVFPITGKIDALFTTPRLSESEHRFEMALIRRVWDVYGHLTAIGLSRMTHEEGSPWVLARDGNRRGVVISEDSMRKFFGQKAASSA